MDLQINSKTNPDPKIPKSLVPPTNNKANQNKTTNQNLLNRKKQLWWPAPANRKTKKENTPSPVQEKEFARALQPFPNLYLKKAPPKTSKIYHFAPKTPKIYKKVPSPSKKNQKDHHQNKLKLFSPHHPLPVSSASVRGAAPAARRRVRARPAARGLERRSVSGESGNGKKEERG